MNKLLRKSDLLLIVILSTTLVLVGCVTNKREKIQQRVPLIKKEIKINEKNAKALNIGKPEDTSKDNGKLNTITKVENTSNFNTSNIYIHYDELDKNKNVIFKSKSFLDVTLSPGEVAYIDMSHQKYATSASVTGYQYRVGGKIVIVNLNKDTIEIKDKNIEVDDSKTYEALAISDVKQVNESNEGNAYTVKIKNLLPKELGNVVLKVAELNESGEYIMINHIPFYEVLKPSEEENIDIISSSEADKVEIVGYSYDNPDEKVKVSIDLKSNQVEINK
ncbi:hypothetical protein [Asaccharospora irregularis]|uniref:Lipoprotein n=1 Tax=Asaccharospora irregularis DSM 2635 TaxID=1121321 RepID=A0A1M5N5F4_9FIRM|nr:hypothetical protein [Asaccharospora irregularis]SHG84399.1 hypothetical protein SAMN04488530_1093 [Asaccharospora irregularis DSM 2635]